MESVLLPEQDYQFSVDHMTLNNGFHLAQDDGGEYTMGMAYLASWKGPVFEKDDPYGDNKTNPDLTVRSMCRRCRSSMEKIMRR